jgi:LCP family protein required for cell wall assembly
VRFLVPRSRAGMVWRIFAAAVIVIGSCAAAVATAGLLQVNTLVQIISVHPGIVSKQIKPPKPGKPETLLLIGSDHRAGSPSTRDANTDTMLLLRLNSASSTINVLSIPRDLEVDVPGYGTEKLNAAYSEGGYSLLIKTIRQQVFPGFYPNHVIDTNFTGFSDIVDAIGCVYSDVDHRYYNISGPVGSATNFSSIDIQPGYQKLCGDNQSISGALPFVRFRHTDTDIVRNARQQDFLRWAKDGFPLSKLLSNKTKLLRIFANHSTTDKQLQSEDGLIDLFDLVAFSDGDTLKQITFPAILPSADVTGPSYVTAQPAAERATYRAFLTPTRKTSKSTTSKGAPKAGHVKDVSKKSKIDVAGLSSDPADGLAQAKALTHPGMPVYYPRLIATDSDYCTVITANCDDPVEPATAYAHSYPRQYLIPVPGEGKRPAYRMTLVINSVLGEYYGIQGVKWKNPPILNDPTETKVIHGRKLTLYADDGGHLTQVAWHQGAYTYWVSNTLTSVIPNHELVGIAASMVRYRG